MQYFQFDKKRTFVSNLFWHPLDKGGNSKKRKALISSIATEQSCDLINVRDSNIPQVGFASTDNGMHPGMISIAALIADVLEKEGVNSFLYAGQVENNLLVCVGVYDGIIIVDNLGSDDQISAIFHEHFTKANWEKFYAPAHWDFANAEDKPFQELLPRKGKRIVFPRSLSLRPVTIKLLNKRNIMIVTLFAAVFFGFHKGMFLWKEYKEQKEQEQLMAQQEETRQKNIAPQEHPWKKSPRALDMTSACRQAFSSRRIWAGNWLLGDMQCTKDQLRLIWSRKQNGWIDQIKTTEPHAVVSQDGNSASLSIPIKPETGSDEEVPEKQKRVHEILNTAQFYGINTSLKSLEPSPPSPDSTQSVPVRDWNEIGWIINDVPFRPETITSLFDAPGFRINAIKTKIQEDGRITWTLEGIQYVK